MAWFLDHLERFHQEKNALEALSGEAWLAHSWHLVADGTLEVHVDITVHDRVYEGVLRYPEAFPNALPYICPRNLTERWSSHQFVGGALCLEWRADNWHPQVTGADIVRSAFKLLSTENHPLTPESVPSAHRLTIGQTLRSRRARLVVTADLRAKLGELPLSSTTRLAVVTMSHEHARTWFVTGISSGESNIPIVDLPAGIANPYPLFAWPVDGVVFRAESWAGQSQLSTVEDLIHILEAAGMDSTALNGLSDAKGLATLVVLAGANLDDSLAFTIDAAEPSVLNIVSMVVSGTSMARVAPEAEKLALVRIAVVGLGSIGSKMAVSLARSGARRLLLVDDDVLLGENIVRHELDWASVGTHKASAVRAKLLLIAPDIEATPRLLRINGQDSPTASAAVLKEISACDLIIDATANPHVFLRLAGVAQASKKSMVWAQVYAGGFGGVIARARPGLDPNPLAVRDGITDHYSGLPVAPFQTAGGYDDTSDSPFVAYDSDIGYVAAAATHLALDTALGRNPSLFAANAYRLGLREEWDFTGPFEVQAITISGPGWDTDLADVDAEVAQESMDSIRAIILDATNDPRPAAA
jgi:ubiquitin-protein ligase